MSEPYVLLFGEAQRLVSSGVSLGEVMEGMASFGHNIEPHADWTSLAKIPTEGELSKSANWLTQLLGAEPPEPRIKTLWFGLFTAGLEDDTTTLMLYLGGSTESASSPDMSMDYFPDGRYFQSAVLDTIFRIAYSSDQGLGNTAEYSFGLAYAGSLISHAVKRQDIYLLLNGATRRDIVVGFDSGDYVEIGTVTVDGFTNAPLL